MNCCRYLMLQVYHKYKVMAIKFLQKSVKQTVSKADSYCIINERLRRFASMYN